jgi:hypothetical protein
LTELQDDDASAFARALLMPESLLRKAVADRCPTGVKERDVGPLAKLLQVEEGRGVDARSSGRTEAAEADPS